MTEKNERAREHSPRNMTPEVQCPRCPEVRYEGGQGARRNNHLAAHGLEVQWTCRFCRRQEGPSRYWYLWRHNIKCHGASADFCKIEFGRVGSLYRGHPYEEGRHQPRLNAISLNEKGDRHPSPTPSRSRSMDWRAKPEHSQEQREDSRDTPKSVGKGRGKGNAEGRGNSPLKCPGH